VLLSDLEILPDEVQRLVPVLAHLRREGFTVRIVPLSPRPEQRHLIEQLVGNQSLLPVPTSGEEGVRAPGEDTLAAGLPWLFLGFGLVLVVVPAANERVLARLEVSR